MRSGELARLERSDVDLRTGRLRIIATKFQKSRELALHPSTVEVLNTYRRERDRYFPHAASAAFFLSCQGTRLSQAALERSFAWLVDETGLAPPPGSRARRPRLHDARHSFTVATVLGWHRDGLDVQSLLPALSAQLGHADPASTYWYLTGVPELLAVTAKRVRTAREGER